MPQLSLPPRLARAAGSLLLNLLADLAAVAAGRAAPPPEPVADQQPPTPSDDC